MKNRTQRRRMTERLFPMTSGRRAECETPAYLVVLVVLLSFSSPTVSGAERVLQAEADADGPIFETTGAQRGISEALSFGFVDEDGFAVQGETWTFDHGGPDPLEGISVLNLAGQAGTFGRRIDAATWISDPENSVDAPILTGTGSLWFGLFQSEANEVCYENGLGYGNRWVQQLRSPVFSRSPGEALDIDWRFFSELEINDDEFNIYLELLPSSEVIPLGSFTGPIGLAGNHPIDPPPGSPVGAFLLDTDLMGALDFRLLFEVVSSPTGSDEDGGHDSFYGAAGFDDVKVTEIPSGMVVADFDFDSGLDGWETVAPPSPLSNVGVAPLGNYVIEDDCCDLAGNVLEMHDEFGEHPDGQNVRLTTPPVDVVNDVLPFFGDGNLIIELRWDQYALLPSSGGMRYRIGFQYYPYECPATGDPVWSPPVAVSPYGFTPNIPSCQSLIFPGTNTSDPVPQNAEQVRAIYEIYSSCDHFGVPPEDCLQSNETPLIDNVRIDFREDVVAPYIGLDAGSRYQDGFSQATFNDLSTPGRADVTISIRTDGENLFVLGDSLVISGELVTGSENSWEPRLWFRMAETSPGHSATYDDWISRVNSARGVDVEAGEFAFAYMDSVQIGPNPFNYRFSGYLREDEWASFGVAGPELSESVEIIPDNVLLPGSQVEYFLSARYLSGGEEYLLPDTSGGNFYEFEILPRWRDLGDDVIRFPCLLFVETYHRGTGRYVKSALTNLGIDYDEYDYLDATSSWKSPLARGANALSNNGATLAQLLGYRTVLISTGASESSNLMFPSDYELLHSWLLEDTSLTGKRMLMINGTGAPSVVEEKAPGLAATLGFTVLDDRYSDFSGDFAPCVEIDTPSGGGELFGTSHSGGDYDIDAFSTRCPPELRTDVLQPTGSGVGNRSYHQASGGAETGFSQIVSAGEGDTWGAVVDGTAWHLMVDRDVSGNCTTGDAEIIDAISNEIRAAREWFFGVGGAADYCEDPTLPPSSTPDLPGSGVSARTHLERIEPNPFHPRTTLSYTLAVGEAVEISIYDVKGRRVRRLSQGTQEAGRHQAVWDGTGDDGQSLPSGTYWARMETESYHGASRLVLLK